MKRIDKRFTGVHALRQVDFDLEEGEIHALVGENGAGKSTLMKVLIGINPKDSGEIHCLGHQFNPRMMDHLTVAQNIFIGRESTRAGGILLDKREQNLQTEGRTRTRSGSRRSNWPTRRSREKQWPTWTRAPSSTTPPTWTKRISRFCCTTENAKGSRGLTP